MPGPRRCANSPGSFSWGNDARNLSTQIPCIDFTADALPASTSGAARANAGPVATYGLATARVTA
jgi:hypothetical protein